MKISAWIGVAAGIGFSVCSLNAETWKTNGPTGGFDVKVAGAETPAPVLTTVDVVPKSDLKPNAEFPSAMGDFVGEAMVWVDFTVTDRGRVKDPMVKASSLPGFDEAALKTVSKWKFSPGSKDGKAVEVPMRVAMSFSRFGARSHLTTTGVNELKTIEEYNQLVAVRGYDLTPLFKGVLMPIHPYDLLVAKTSGSAEVEFVVTPEGKARQVNVLKASHPEFGEALVAAIEAGDFVPASKQGKPVVAAISIERPFDTHAMPGPKARDIEEVLALLKSSPEKIVSPKTLDTPLKPLVQRAPVFPGSAKSEDGTAVVEVIIDKDGRVLLPKIISASQVSMGFAAAQAVDGWVFEKPVSGGKPVVVRVRIPFKFTALKTARAKIRFQPSNAGELSRRGYQAWWRH